MSKELTEKWKNGTLPDGFYYMQDYTGRYCYRYLLGVKPDADFVKCFKEVLAPVPSYEEYNKLKEQIAEANDVIKKYAYPKSVCKSITENQEVWEVIAYTETKEGLDYLEKWGVK